MIDIKAILCQIDFSDFSRHALTHAVQLARWFGASLTVLHVYALPAAPPPVMVVQRAPAPSGETDAQWALKRLSENHATNPAIGDVLSDMWFGFSSVGRQPMIDETWPGPTKPSSRMSGESRIARIAGTIVT